MASGIVQKRSIQEETTYNRLLYFFIRAEIVPD